MDAHLEYSRISELFDHESTGPSAWRLAIVGLNALDVVRLRFFQLRYQIIQLPVPERSSDHESKKRRYRLVFFADSRDAVCAVAA